MASSSTSNWKLSNPLTILLMFIKHHELWLIFDDISSRLIISCSLNYDKEPGYVHVPHLPKWVKWPTDLISYNLKNIENMLEFIEIDKNKCDPYFKKEISIFNILDSVKYILKENQKHQGLKTS